MMATAELLRVYLGERDKADGKPLWQAIVLAAREAGLSGATVLRGPLGYGRSSRLHTARILDLSVDLPVVIEIIDTAERITGFLPHLASIAPGELATIETVRVVQGLDSQSE
jgi:PII-like signaling protein